MKKGNFVLTFSERKERKKREGCEATGGERDTLVTNQELRGEEKGRECAVLHYFCWFGSGDGEHSVTP